MAPKKRRRGARGARANAAFGTLALAPPLLEPQYTAPLLELYTAPDHAPDPASLVCPSYTECDVAIGTRVFGADESGIDAEMRAYEVLGEIHASNEEFNALNATRVEPNAHPFEAAHVLVDRYTPWSEYARGSSSSSSSSSIGAARGIVRL